MKRLAWLLLAAACFGMAIASGAIAAQGFFFDSFPTWREFVEHVLVIFIGTVLAIAFFYGCVICAEKALV